MAHLSGAYAITLKTLQTGENQSSNRQDVNSPFPPTNITTATTTNVMSGAGVYGGMTVNKKVANGVITLYDSLTASGTKIGTITYGASLLSDPIDTAPLQYICSVGLTIVTSAAFDITVGAKVNT